MFADTKTQALNMSARNIKDYPKYPFEQCLHLADIVYQLGDGVHSEKVAIALGRKPSGSFRLLIGSAVKHKLVIYSNWVIYLSPNFKAFLAADGVRREELLQECFLVPHLYREVSERCGFQASIETLVPVMLEQGVDAEQAGVIARNFRDGAAYVGLNASMASGHGVDKGQINPTTESTSAAENDNRIDFDKESDAKPATSDSLEDLSSLKGSSVEFSSTTPQNYTPQESKEMTDTAEKGAVENQPTTLVEKNSSEVETLNIQMHLPNRRMAQLIVPTEIYSKDLVIIRKYIEALEELIPNK